MAINLIEEYNSHKNGGAQYWRDEFNKWKSERLDLDISDTNADLRLKTGDLISFMSGHNGDINYISEVLGFNSDGRIFVLWDCYWFPINPSDLKRKIEKLEL